MLLPLASAVPLLHVMPWSPRTATAFTPLRGASHFSLLVQRTSNQKKHTLPPRPRCSASRVHSAAGIFRRDIPVSSKNDVHPCTSPRWGLIRQLRRCGRGPDKARAKAKAALIPTLLPQAGEGLKQQLKQWLEQKQKQQQQQQQQQKRYFSASGDSQQRSKDHKPALTSLRLPMPPCRHPSIQQLG